MCRWLCLIARRHPIPSMNTPVTHIFRSQARASKEIHEVNEIRFNQWLNKFIGLGDRKMNGDNVRTFTQARGIVCGTRELPSSDQIQCWCLEIQARRCSGLGY